MWLIGIVLKSKADPENIGDGFCIVLKHETPKQVRGDLNLLIICIFLRAALLFFRR